MEKNDCSILRVYASSTDRLGHKLLYEQLTFLARESGIAGVTVYRGIMGYGQSSSHIHSSKFWELTDKLPVVIEMVDHHDTIEAFYRKIEPELQDMPKGCLVTVEPVGVLLRKPGKR